MRMLKTEHPALPRLFQHFGRDGGVQEEGVTKEVENFLQNLREP